jgi:hypothetical protein
MCPDTFLKTTNLHNCIPPKFRDLQGKVCRITFSNSSLEPTENSKPKMKRQLVFALLINPSSMQATHWKIYKEKQLADGRGGGGIGAKSCGREKT